MTSSIVSLKLIFYQALAESFQREELYLKSSICKQVVLREEGRAFVIVVVVLVVRFVVITISIFTGIVGDSKVMC